MLTTLTWWGIGLLLATTTLATIIAITVTWKRLTKGITIPIKLLAPSG